MSRCA